MFSGFDDGGWWPGVKGCRVGRRSPEMVGKPPELAGSAAVVGEKKRREKMEFMD